MTSVNRSLIKKILIYSHPDVESDLDPPRVRSFLDSFPDPMDLIVAINAELRRTLYLSADIELRRLKSLPAIDMLTLIKHLRHRSLTSSS